MKNSVNVGMNRTGLGLAPRMSPEMLDENDEPFKAFAQAAEDPLPTQTDREIRQGYIRESGPVGSLPPPSTVKGVLMTGAQKIMLHHPEMLLDKLGERLAFERSGARLYEAFIQKCETVLPDHSIEFLREIQREEIRHFHLLTEAIESLGADPTAVTPCANVVGVSSMGLIQVVSDPRTGIAQAALAILTAELVDNDGWSLLVKLTEKAGLTDLTERFMEARENEERHLTQIRTWLNTLVLANDVTEHQLDDRMNDPTTSQTH